NETYTITGIGEYAFYGCSSLESITLPSSLTSISSHDTFDDCSALTTVYYNATNCDDIQDFSGNYPFSHCSNLTSIIIGSNVQYIPANLFRNSTAKTVTFQDDSQLGSIGNYAFYECKSLETINLPESLETIGDGVFSYCSALESITIPKSITSISNDSPFSACTALTTVYFNAANCADTHDISGNFLFDSCIALTDIIIGEDVEYIPANLFYNCSTIVSLTFNATNCNSSGSNAFDDEASISSLTIGKDVTTIPDVITNMTAFTSLNYNASTTSTDLLNNDFFTKNSITELTIGEDVTTIPGNFSQLSSLSTLNYNAANAEMPSGSETSLFVDCESISDITIGETVESIPAYLLAGLTSIESIEIPDGVTSIGKYAFSNCTNLETIELTNTIKSLGDGVFSGCTKLESVDGFGDLSVTSIPDYTFRDCSGLTTIDMPSTVTEIGAYAFNGCSSLSSILIPTDLTTIGDYAFAQCTSLATLIYNAADIESFGTEAFSSCKITTLTIGEEVESIPEDLSQFTSITTLNYNAANAEMPSGSETSIFANCTELSDITIGEAVESIPAYLFAGLTTIDEIEIPSGVTSIGDYAFSNCSALETIELSGSLESLGDYVFNNCTALASIDIPSSAESLGDGVFSGCTNLESVSGFGDLSIESVPDYTFNDCSALTSINIPSTVTEIGASAFNRCSNLNSIELPSDLATIGDYTFAECASITLIEIPSSVESIGESAFADCTSLEEVYTSNTTPAECGDNAFKNVPSDCVLYVPVSSEDDYSSTQVWNNFANITGVYYTSVADNAITLKAPAESSEISCDSIAAGDEIIIIADGSGEMTVTVYDTESSDILYNGDIENINTISASSYKYTWTCPSDITFYNSHSYALDIALSDGGSATIITYNGTTDNIVLESYTPDEDTAWTEAEDKDIVLTFSGLVKVEEASLNGQTSLESNATGEDTTDDGYSSEWTITVSADDVEAYNGSSISISVTTVNQNGNTVYDKDGNDILLSYQIGIDDGVYEGYTFDPEDSTTVGSLSSITVGYTLEYDEEENITGGGLGLSYNNSVIEIYDSSDNVVATITDDECEEIYGSDDDSDPAYYVCTNVVISFDEIKTDGVYTVVIPAGFFNLISGDTSKSSGQITLTYTVDSTTTGINALNAASNDDRIYNLSGQRVNNMNRRGIYIVNGKKVVRKGAK
ncbi:MAG: leucine-rich repeat domain-containing protein, partial [Prevotella sp.]|nr:leucine-rich repeat domain-containing protein [Prevotella sp.]